MSLTDLQIRKLKAKEKPYKTFDRDGLYLHVRPRGSKVWRYKYNHAGKEKLISFGSYPEVSLQDARERQFESRQLLTRGIDPSSKKREDKLLSIYKAQNKFTDVVTEWHSTNKTRWNTEHAEKINTRIKSHLVSSLGRRPIEDIKPVEVLAILKQVETENGAEIARRILGYANNIFKYAVITGRIENNPAACLAMALKPKPNNHYPTIPATELKCFLSKLEYAATSIQNKLAVKLLLATILRTGELRRTKWEHIDFKKREWKVPAEVMKMKLPHIVPLSSYTIALLLELKRLTGDSEYILPSQQKRRNAYMSENTINYVIGKIGYGDRLVGHGFRSLASTTLNEHGFNRDAIERQLAHKEPNKIRAAYNRAEYLEERGEMMEWWGEFIKAQS